MLLGVALVTTLVAATPAISTPDGLANQGSINSFFPLSSAATSQPLIDSGFIPFPSVQFSTPLTVLTTSTQVINVPQPFPTSVGRIQPSIGSPTSVLGSFTPAIGTTVTTLGSFQPSIGSPISSLGSFAPGRGLPLATLGSFQPSIGTPTTVLGSFQPGIGGLQRNVIAVSTASDIPVLVVPVLPVTLAKGTELSGTTVDGFFVPSTRTALNVALTSDRLIALNPADPSVSNILNPEPSSLVLFGTALGGLALLRKLSSRKTSAPGSSDTFM